MELATEGLTSPKTVPGGGPFAIVYSTVSAVRWRGWRGTRESVVASVDVVPLLIHDVRILGVSRRHAIPAREHVGLVRVIEYHGDEFAARGSTLRVLFVHDDLVDDVSKTTEPEEGGGEGVLLTTSWLWPYTKFCCLYTMRSGATTVGTEISGSGSINLTVWRSLCKEGTPLAPCLKSPGV